jgi:phosphatidylserine/phosphatidylglycerophosphate/cardiolipin synthase-like enzyme
MDSASDRIVHGANDVLKRAACRHPDVRVLTGDVLDVFVRAALRAADVRRISLVSPWVSDAASRGALGRLIAHARRSSAGIVLITRPPATAAHRAAIDLVRSYERGRVILDPQLHAKLYLCDVRVGRGVAVIGSANLTESSARLREVALLVRAAQDSRIIRQLSTGTLKTLATPQRRKTTMPRRGQ